MTKRVLFLVLVLLTARTIYAQPPRVDSGQQQLPAALGPNGGLKVECIGGTCSGGGGSSSDLTASASLTSVTCPGSGCVTLTLTQPSSTATISVQGTFNATVDYRASLDGVIFDELFCNNTDSGGTVDKRTQSTPVIVQCNIAGYSYVRAWATVYTSGTADVIIHATIGASEPINTSTLLNSINNGVNEANNLLGAVNGISSSTDITSIGGTAVTPGQLNINCVSGCGSPAATADGTAFISGTTNVSPVGYLVDDVATTTVPENSYGAARMNTNRILYTDISKTASNTNAIKVDGSAVTQPVSGTFWQATQPVSGTVTLSSTNFNLQLIQGTAAAVNSGIVNNGTLRVALASGGGNVTQAGTWANRITDGTNTATVEPASTLPLSTDTALVVTARDPVILGTGSNAIGSITNTSFNVGNFPATQPVSGTFFQATQPVSLTSTTLTGTSAVSLATLPALTTGAAVIGSLVANQSVNVAQMNGVTTSMSNGVSDTGTQRVALAQEATYAAGLTLKTATAAGTAPFFSLCGSGTKTIRVQRFSVSGTVATAAVWGDVILKKTNTAAVSGGTATTLTAGPYDSNSAAATGVAKFYTVLATTTGTLVNVILSLTQLFPVTAISATLQPTPAPIIYIWRDQDAEAPTLRGANECMSANFGTTTTNAPTLTVSVAWTEK